jgi:hypothetical protein
MTEQTAHLERVASKISEHILTFCAVNKQFRMDELVTYVQSQVSNVAPDSPSRILRYMRRDGLINYTVLSRKDSLYGIVESERMIPTDLTITQSELTIC